MTTQLDQEFWEQRWDDIFRNHPEAARGRGPNPQLVTEAADLSPGTALDAGCGHGVDAIWLASRGWHVTAVDFATTALRRARAGAEALGDEIAARIAWRQADLGSWTPIEDHFDLVSTHYAHSVVPRDAMFRRLAAAVAPGGTLLIVGHHPSDQMPGSPPVAPDLYFTVDEIGAALDPGRWDVVAAETRTRSDVDGDGHDIVRNDAVWVGRKHP